MTGSPSTFVCTSRNNKVEGTDFAEPLVFKIGSGAALPGFEEGVVGMAKGGIRRIIVPAELGYSKYPGLEPIPKTPLGECSLRAACQAHSSHRSSRLAAFTLRVRSISFL